MSESVLWKREWRQSFENVVEYLDDLFWDDEIPFLKKSAELRQWYTMLFQYVDKDTVEDAVGMSLHEMLMPHGQTTDIQSETD